MRIEHGWPGLHTALKVRRTTSGRKYHGQQVEEAYAITDLRLRQVDLETLGRWWREHWHIENRLHYVRDVTLGEDHSQVRTGAAPRIMAGLRNAVLGVLRLAGHSNIAAALRRMAARPKEALRNLGLI